MVKPHGHTKFRDQWLLDSEVKSWVRRIPGDESAATCVLCPGTIISVTTMGRQALISHKNTKKHAAKENAKNVHPSLDNMFRQATCKAVEQPCTSGTPLTPTCISDSKREEQNVVVTTKSKENIMDRYVLNDKVTRSEIIWVLHSVCTHRTNSAAAKDIHIMKYMFPENEVISKMQLERTKIGYMIVFGLAPYFKNILLDDLKLCQHFVVGFDESLNKISQSQQMDIVVRYWSTTDNRVVTRYLTSVFLKRATAADLLTSFLASTNCLDLQKLLQISMDGPNVNKKFLRDLNDHLQDGLKYDKKMLDLGSCGLHTLHCAFKAAITTTGWNIVEYLRALYNFFRDHPARRGMFTRMTGCTIFPKKFCAIRWLENDKVSSTAIDMMPHIKTFLSKLEEEKDKKPKTNSFLTIERHFKDPLLCAQLAFFKTLSEDIQPLMKEYQSNLPLAPFLFSSLRELVIKEMERFVKPDKISPSLKIIKNGENLLASKNTDVGIGAKCEIGKARDKCTQLQIATFKHECREALKCFVERMLDRSPLQHEATKYISCLDPSISATKLGQERFEKLVVLLCNNNLMTTQTSEQAQREFRSLCNDEGCIEKIKNYKRFDMLNETRNRLDVFWVDLIESYSPNSFALVQVIKKVMILSHGNAAVERGFSVNKECLVENLKEESLIGMRTVFDAVSQEGEVGKVNLSKSMILSARNAHAKYKDALNEQKNKENEEKAETLSRKRNQMIVRELEDKKRKLAEEVRRETEKIDKEISTLVKL